MSTKQNNIKKYRLIAVHEKLNTSSQKFIEIIIFGNECAMLDLKFEILFARLDRQYTNHRNMTEDLKKIEFIIYHFFQDSKQPVLNASFHF